MPDIELLQPGCADESLRGDRGEEAPHLQVDQALHPSETVLVQCEAPAQHHVGPALPQFSGVHIKNVWRFVT